MFPVWRIEAESCDRSNLPVVVSALYVRYGYNVRTMAKKLTKTGNSLAIIIDRPILESTGIDESTPLEISTDGDVIVIARERSRKRSSKIRKAQDEINKRYGGVFKRLAE